MSDPLDDRSAGYELIALDYVACRSDIGVRTVRAWARTLPRGATVLDIGCGHGEPISAALLDQGLAVHGIDPSPTMVEGFRARFPGVPVECGAIEASDRFGLRFDAAIAWGVIFLLAPDEQRNLIMRASSLLKPGGRFLFTAPTQRGEWADLLTRRTSVSLGEEAYRRLVADAGLAVLGEDDDEGGNHYYLAGKAVAGAGRA